MPYSASAYRLLISAPGDVPSEDIDVAIATINRWNVIYGQQFGAVVVPVHWQVHSAAEYGTRPQESLNAQLVEPADILIALFWHRLGSATGRAQSGTVEEIHEAHGNGAYVAVLRCERDFPHDVNADQVTKLREFYEELRDQSLMLAYRKREELARHVDAILTQAVSRDGARAKVSAEVTPERATVWPRVESKDQVDTDSKGRVRTRRRWTLVLANTGNEPARNVSHRLEPEQDGDVLPLRFGDERALEVLPPGSEARYGLALHGGVASQVRCVVGWRDEGGDHENYATLRFF